MLNLEMSSVLWTSATVNFVIVKVSSCAIKCDNKNRLPWSVCVCTFTYIYIYIIPQWWYIHKMQVAHGTLYNKAQLYRWRLLSCLLTTSWMVPFFFSPDHFRKEFKILIHQTTGQFPHFPSLYFLMVEMKSSRSLQSPHSLYFRKTLCDAVFKPKHFTKLLPVNLTNYKMFHMPFSFSLKYFFLPLFQISLEHIAAINSYEDDGSVLLTLLADASDPRSVPQWGN